MYYSMIGLLSALTLLIVNQDILFDHKASFGRPAWLVYRRFLYTVLIYYVTDILWGILENLKMGRLLFADTTAYFVAMAAGVLFWAEFTVTYLQTQSSSGRILLAAGRAIAGMTALFTLVNIFIPVLFTVDAASVYAPMPIRHILLFSQIFYLVVISVFAYGRMFRLKRGERKRPRYRILGTFGMIMVIFLVAQLWFPYLPLYAMAYLLGTCMLHAFVANDEKEEYQRELEEAEKIGELTRTITSLLNNMPGLTFSKDAATGVYLACNQAFAEYAHKEKPDGVTGHTDAELFDSKTAEQFARDDEIALSLSVPYIFYEDVLDATGKERQLQTTRMKYTDTFGRLCVLGMSQDVTDLVRVQHENTTTKEAYEKAVSAGLVNSRIAMTLSREYTDMFYVNGDTEEFVEYGRKNGGSGLSELRRGWHFFSDGRAELAEQVFPEDREAFLQALNRKTLVKALEKTNTFTMSYRVQSGDGPVYVGIRVSRMEDDGTFMIIAITDIDRRMQEALNRCEELAAALAKAGLAHEEQRTLIAEACVKNRTSVNTVIGLGTLARKKGEMDSKTRLYLEKIDDSARSLLAVTNEMSDQSRSGDAGPEPETADGAKELPPLYVLVTEDDPAMAEYYGTILEDAGIRADIAANAEEACSMTKLQHEKNKPYHIVLLDWDMPGRSGLDAAARIHRQFGEESVVVVLTVCNWEEIQEEAQRQGVEGFLQKPLLPENVRDEIERIVRRSRLSGLYERKRISLAGCRILLADDMKVNAKELRNYLAMENISADYAGNGRAAVEIFEKSAVGTYAAIVMDVRMPEMDGLKATAVIRSLSREDAKRIPIIAMTENAFDEDTRRALQAGMDAHITKPVDGKRLIRLLGELVQG